MIALLLACGTAQAEGWACNLDKARGYTRDVVKDQWTAVPFTNLSGAKYVIRKTEKSDAGLPAFIRSLPHEWTVYDSPDRPPLAYCGVNKTKKFVCMPAAAEYDIGPTYSIRFDPKSLRFMAAVISDYATMVQIGTCFPI
jgi:hypothetical protein